MYFEKIKHIFIHTLFILDGSKSLMKLISNEQYEQIIRISLKL